VFVCVCVCVRVCVCMCVFNISKMWSNIYKNISLTFTSNILFIGKMNKNFVIPTVGYIIFKSSVTNGEIGPIQHYGNAAQIGFLSST